MKKGNYFTIICLKIENPFCLIVLQFQEKKKLKYSCIANEMNKPVKSRRMCME